MTKIQQNSVCQKKLNHFNSEIEKLNRFSQTHFHAGWLKKPIMSGKYHAWLLNRGSLTFHLQKYYTKFSVKPLLNMYTKPLLDEIAPLAILLQHKTLIREVLLVGNQVPVVFAHSVLPRKSLRGGWLSLAHLGNKPLGAVLFANPKVQRTALSFKKLSPHHALYQRAARHLKYSVDEKPAYLWARRSIFSLNCANIMVTEVFLPALFNN